MQNWRRRTAKRFMDEPSAHVRWYRERHLKAFHEGGYAVYEKIRGRKARLGLTT